MVLLRRDGDRLVTVEGHVLLEQVSGTRIMLHPSIGPELAPRFQFIQDRNSNRFKIFDGTDSWGEIGELHVVGYTSIAFGSGPQSIYGEELSWEFKPNN